MGTFTRRVSFIALLAVLAIAPVRAGDFEGQEYDSSYLSDKFYYSAGWFNADVTTDIAYGFGRYVGTLIRLENDLDLNDRKDSLLFEANWRFSRKHSLYAFGTKLNRGGQVVLEREFDINNPDDPDNGYRFTAGAVVNSLFNNTYYGFTYRYSFYNNGKIEGGVSVGLSFYDFSLGLSGRAAAIDQDGNVIAGTGFRVYNESFIAPIPTVGVHFAYALDPRWIFRFYTNVLDLSVGDFEGSITQARVDIQWYFVKNVSLGAGLTSSNIDVRDNSDDPWEVQYRFSGYTVFVGAAF